MTQFMSFSPDVEVKGSAMNTLTEGLGAYKLTGLQLLEKHGVANLQNDEWYSQQMFLNVFKEIAESVGDSVLRAIGNKAPEIALWPDDINTIEGALASIDVAYHMNHRNGPIGNYTFKKTSERSGTMTCYNPYPCAFDYGLIEGTGRKFAPDKVYFNIEHDKVKFCRKNGGDSCVYLLTW